MSDHTTPDDHLKTLNELAHVFELAVRNGARRPQIKHASTLSLCEARAKALRWILAETAYPVTDEMVTDEQSKRSA